RRERAPAPERGGPYFWQESGARGNGSGATTKPWSRQTRGARRGSATRAGSDHVDRHFPKTVATPPGPTLFLENSKRGFIFWSRERARRTDRLPVSQSAAPRGSPHPSELAARNAPRIFRQPTP